MTSAAGHGTRAAAGAPSPLATMSAVSNHRLARSLGHMVAPELAAADTHDYTQASKDTDHEFKTPPKNDRWVGPNTSASPTALPCSAPPDPWLLRCSGKRDFPHIKTIGVVGGGVMGGGIAQMTALGGYKVIVQDISEDACQLARDEMIDSKWGMKAAVMKGKISYQECEAAIPRLTTTTSADDLADCDLIIEAVPEKLGENRHQPTF